VRTTWRRLIGGADHCYVALDIGSRAVKLLEVCGAGEALEVIRAGIAPTPEGALRNNRVHDVATVAAVIRRLVEGLGVASRRAVTAVPSPTVIIKRVRLEARPDDDLDALVVIEAASCVPESLDNVSLDYHVRRVDEDEVEALIVAVRKDILAGYTSAIAGAGLEPSIVDVDCFALENAFERSHDTDPEDLVALVDVGARHSSIHLVKDRVSPITGDVQAGAAEIAAAIVAATGLSGDAAERALMGEAVAAEQEARVRGIVSAGVEALAAAIEQSLRFLWRTASDDLLQAVYVSGGGARLAGLCAALGERLGRPVELVDPLAGVRVRREIDAAMLAAMAPLFAVVVGLGTRRLDDS
jgi:type IV pilus assembly protein PilM